MLLPTLCLDDTARYPVALNITSRRNSPNCVLGYAKLTRLGNSIAYYPFPTIAEELIPFAKLPDGEADGAGDSQPTNTFVRKPDDVDASAVYGDYPVGYLSQSDINREDRYAG